MLSWLRLVRDPKKCFWKYGLYPKIWVVFCWFLVFENPFGCSIFGDVFEFRRARARALLCLLQQYSSNPLFSRRRKIMSPDRNFSSLWKHRKRHYVIFVFSLVFRIEFRICFRKQPYQTCFLWIWHFQKRRILSGYVTKRSLTFLPIEN